MSNLLFCQWSLTDESLSHTQRRHRFYSLMIFMCFIKIHKVNSSKYEWSLDLLTVIFDSWISISNTKGTQRFYSWKVFICFFKIYHVKSSNMNGLWISWQWSLTDESLSHTQRGHRFYSLMIFMYFIKVHKVNCSKYEWSLDWLPVIFDSWIFITNKKETKSFYSWMNIHVFYQNPQGEIFREWMVFRFVDSDIWQLNLCHKQKRAKKVLFMKSIHMFFQNLPGEIFKV